MMIELLSDRGNQVQEQILLIQITVGMYFAD